MRRLMLRFPVGFAATFLALGVAWAGGVTPPASAPSPPPAPRVVNVTSDSTPGWLPSEELEQQARKTALEFLAEMDRGQYEEAYGFLADVDRKDQTLSDFSDRVRQFNAQAGAVIERRIATVTWTKNPAHAPLPGIYAALDLVSRFANIDRHCGFLILYQAPSGQNFQVMREEDNFLDNATAANIAKRSSSEAVDKAWADLSAHCPNYRPDTNLNTQAAQGAPPAPLPEASGSQIGYPTVAAALAALHAKAGVTFKNDGGWTIAEDAESQTVWSFPPPGNAAYPAAVKRQAVQRADGTYIDMAVQCEATKAACDDLVRSFQQLNAQMGANMRDQ